MSSKKGQKHKHRKPQGNSTTPNNVANFEPLNPNPLYHIGTVLIETAAIIFCTSIATVSSQLALHPLYGSTTTSLHFRKVVAGSCILSITRPSMPTHRTLLLLAVLLAAGPLSAKGLGSVSARFGDANWGPAISQLSLAAPITGLASVLLRGRLVSIDFCSYSYV